MKLKAVVLSPTMNLILMVALLVVGSAILLKVFNIDVGKLLGGMFNQFTDPQPMKALHVKLEADPGKVELWEFHLTDDKDAAGNLKHSSSKHPNAKEATIDLYFYVTVEEKTCPVFVTSERSSDPDLGEIYQAGPGIIIQKDCNNDKNPSDDTLYSCMASLGAPSAACNVGWTADSTGDKCASCRFAGGGSSAVSCAGRFNYINCATVKPVDEREHHDCSSFSTAEKDHAENIKFTSNVVYPESDCGGESCCKSDPDKCNLLHRTGKDKQVKFEYVVKYGILCAPPKAGEEYKWIPCTEKKAEDTSISPVEIEGGVKFRCVWNPHLGEGTWKKI